MKMVGRVELFRCLGSCIICYMCSHAMPVCTLVAKP